MKYDKDLKNLANENKKDLINLENFAKNLIKHSKQNLINLKSKIGSKLSHYLISIVWCYEANKFSDVFFGKLLFALMFHCHLQDDLDFENRAIKFCQNGYEKLDIEQISRFLEMFQECLAYSIQSSDFEFLNLTSKESCDIFDGRLFKLCLLLCSSAETRSIFKTSYFGNNQELINEILKFIRVEFKKFKHITFLTLVDLGTQNASPEELFNLFESFFKSDNLKINERVISEMCMKEKKDTLTGEIRTSSHPLHKKLLNEIECNEIECHDANIRKEFEKTVKEFKKKYNWRDSFRPAKTQLKNNSKNDEKLESIIKDLNIFSFEKNVKKIVMSNDLELIKNEFTKFNLSKACDMVKNLNETNESVFSLLKWLFDFFTNCSNSKNAKELENLIVIILIKADQLWQVILEENKSLELNTKKDYIFLIFNILDYFDFEITKQALLIFVKKNYLIDIDLAIIKIKHKFKLSETEKRFQMKYLSDYLRKEKEISNDTRTDLFTPDQWQIAFLDAIDKSESVLITAPTSSGFSYFFFK